MASLTRVINRHQDIPTTVTFISPKTMEVPAEQESTVCVVNVGMCTTRELGLIERICNCIKGIFFGMIHILTLGCCLRDKAIMQLFAKTEITYYQYKPENAADFHGFLSQYMLPKIEASKKEKEKSILANIACIILYEMSSTEYESLLQGSIKELKGQELLNIIKVLHSNTMDSYDAKEEILLKHVCANEELFRFVLVHAPEWLYENRGVIFSDHQMYPIYFKLMNNLYPKNLSLGIDSEQVKIVLKQLTNQQEGDSASEYAKRVESACHVVGFLFHEGNLMTQSSYFEGFYAAMHGNMSYIEKYKNDVPGFRNSSPYQNAIALSSLRVVAKQCGHTDFLKALDELYALPVQRPRDL